MTKLLLSLHVLAAILAIGPIAVAASMFPRFVRAPAAGQARAEPAGEGRGGGALLHRICRAYTVVGVTVPVFGIATGAQLGVLTDAWLIASLILTTIAAVLLAGAILPAQERLLEPAASDADEPARAARRLAMITGIFNLLWAVVVVLMIVRPGSTTSA
ncbi:hypothetical protein [Streptomyces sp. NBRC 109706]|uniref:hypothetical protein n=1 Tax=Streptomyces sp. NBRC 109706 TaxID=1550035 RepID=UPI000782CE1E|nr:hypothetical protein [Streptomyces sp. NBRC 109706]